MISTDCAIVIGCILLFQLVDVLHLRSIKNLVEQIKDKDNLLNE